MNKLETPFQIMKMVKCPHKKKKNSTPKLIEQLTKNYQYNEEKKNRW